MAATAQRAASSNEAPHPALARAPGVELLGNVDGSGYTGGAALVRRADGQMVQLGPLMYALLDSIDGRRDARELADAMCDRLGRACDEEHVVALAQKLAAQGLLAGSEHNAPPRRNPLLALRWKLLVTNPAVTRGLAAPFTFLFRSFVVLPAVAAFAVVLWFVLFRKGLAAATAQAFDRPGLLLLVFALAVGSAAFHELGHAAACRYGGATPGGMGMGIYLVWPAFYTDVTDAYRLPRRDRLRVDLGGIYFNALVAVVTLAVWLFVRVDALLLLIGLQVLIMVRNLSPVIRSDGYHILADATGVPDLYAHIAPTIRRLVPGRAKDPSALTGRARVLVTLWVLVVVPVLLALMVGAVLLLPRMAATAWDSGRHIVASLPHQSAGGFAASLLRLVALSLPVLGSALIAQRLLRAGASRAWSWAGGRPLRLGALVVVSLVLAAGAAWAWWPAGQYQPIRGGDRGTVIDLARTIARPVRAARPLAAAVPVRLRPGTHLAVALIPVGGATRSHPALFVVPGKDGDPTVAIASTASPDPSSAQVAQTAASASTSPATAGAATLPTTTANKPSPAPTTSVPAGRPQPQTPVRAVAFPFQLPGKPRPGDSQALAVGTTDGGVKYDVVYALVTVSGGAPVTNRNAAYAFASCDACTTVAVSFQVVLVVGQSKTIAPINIADALNANCPSCLTTAIADQIVVTLNSQPTPALVQQIQTALRGLDAIGSLGADASPAAIAAQVQTVQTQVDDALRASGQLTNPPATGTTTTTTPTTPATSPQQTTQATSPTRTSSTPATTAPASTTPASTPTTSTATSPATTTTGATGTTAATTATTTVPTTTTTTPTTETATSPSTTTAPTTAGG